MSTAGRSRIKKPKLIKEEAKQDENLETVLASRGDEITFNYGGKITTGTLRNDYTLGNFNRKENISIRAGSGYVLEVVEAEIDDGRATSN